MIACPSYPLPGTLGANIYFGILYFFTFINPPINFFTLYCIIFRSTSQMKSFRWHLAIQQSFAMIVDLNMLIALRPIVLIPFMWVLPTGLSSFIHCKHLVAVSLFLHSMVANTTVDLFYYRYAAVREPRTVPVVFVVAVYSLYPCSVIMLFAWDFGYSEQSHTASFKNYSCITEQVLHLPNMCFYDRSNIMAAAFPFAFFLCVAYTTLPLLLIFLTNYEIRTRAISTQTKRLQRVLLRQLIFQAGLPYTFIFIPVLLVLYQIVFKVVGYVYVSNIAIFGLSTWSINEAIVVIATNKNYYYILLKPFQRFIRRKIKKNTVTVAPSFIE